MNITKRIDRFLNEGQFQKGQWIIQRRTDENEYGVLVDQLKSGAWAVISKSDERIGGQAKKGSTKGWYPAPEVIDVKQVPPKIKDKVMQKAKQLGISL